MNDPSLSYMERKILHEHPEYSKDKIKEVVNELNSDNAVDNNIVVGVNRGFNDKANACENKWKSFQSNIFNDKKKKQAEIKLQNGPRPITSVRQSRMNTATNSANVSFTNDDEKEKPANLSQIPIPRNKLDVIGEMLINTKTSIKNKNTYVKKKAVNSSIPSLSVRNDKLRWVNGLDWKKDNTELLFNNISKLDENYNCKKHKLRDYQSSINEYEYNKHSGGLTESKKKSKLTPFYTEVKQLQSFQKINGQDRKDIEKNVLQLSTRPHETEGAKIKKIQNTSIFQGVKFAKTFYNDKSQKGMNKDFYKQYYNSMKLNNKLIFF